MKKSAEIACPVARAGVEPSPAHASREPRERARGCAADFEVRRSGIHGRGAYATRHIAKGTRVIEYLGERITHRQADARYEDKGQDDGHTFLFVVSSRIVIDAGVDGNDARFINHSCDPNCDTVIESERVFIEAIRDIEPGEELGYEYGLTWESTDDPEELANYRAAAARRPAAARCWPRSRSTSRRPGGARRAGRKRRPRCMQRAGPRPSPGEQGRVPRRVRERADAGDPVSIIVATDTTGGIGLRGRCHGDCPRISGASRR